MLLSSRGRRGSLPGAQRPVSVEGRLERGEKRKRARDDGKGKEKHATATRQGGGPQVGDIIPLGGVTRLSI